MKKVLIGFAVVVGLVGLIAIFSDGESGVDQAGDSQLSLQDIHGLEVDAENEQLVYLPNHSGLYAQDEAGTIIQVSEVNDDYMSFTINDDGSAMYASGHPRSGGNFGLISSTDGGETWSEVSEGLNGPVDFHAMAVSGNTIYGYYAGALQKSTDSGQSWAYVESAPEAIIQLAKGASAEQVYAATINGLFVSNDGGTSWDQKTDDTNVITAIEAASNGDILAYSVSDGLVRSTDDANSWTNLDFTDTEGRVLYIATSPSNLDRSYVITEQLQVHTTNDGGATWQTR